MNARLNLETFTFLKMKYIKNFILFVSQLFPCIDSCLLCFVFIVYCCVCWFIVCWLTLQSTSFHKRSFVEWCDSRRPSLQTTVCKCAFVRPRRTGGRKQCTSTLSAFTHKRTFASATKHFHSHILLLISSSLITHLIFDKYFLHISIRLLIAGSPGDRSHSLDKRIWAPKQTVYNVQPQRGLVSHPTHPQGPHVSLPSSRWEGLQWQARHPQI